MTKLAWGAKLTAQQRAFLASMASALGTDPSHNSAVIEFESRWDPAAVNAQSGASGLIQFMPSTAIGMGTSVEAIRQMSIDEQLPLCFQYWKQYAGRMKTLSDCYMAVLYPAAIGLAEDSVIFPPGSKTYLQNRGLDIDHDGAVTKAEAAAFVQRRLDEGLQPGNYSEDVVLTREPRPDAPGATFPTNGGQRTMDPLTLVSLLTSVFAPKIRAQADKVLGTDVGTPLVNNLLGMATQLTGRQDPMEAVAVARQNPAVVAQMEKATEDWFAQVGPALEKVAAIDRADLQAADASRDSASIRADGQEVRRRIDSKIWWAYAVAAAVLSGVAIAELLVNKTIDGQIVGALILAFGALGSKIGDMVNYGFGSTAGSQAKDAYAAEANRRASTGAKS